MTLFLEDATMQKSVYADILLFPEELDLASYRFSYADLARMTDAELIQHYESHGRSEGRHGNGLKTRQDFLALIPANARALEIGPFCAPVLKGVNVKYFDVLNREGLERRAEEVGYPHRHAPLIDFVSSNGDLSVVDESFDFVVSCHCIEHQPDLIRHLQKISRILEAGGRYFVLVPDKRYCFDAFLPESNVAEIINAYHESRRVHSLRHIIEHRALTTHNDCILHWADQHGDSTLNMSGRIVAAITEHEQANGGYVDVHAWQFTPDSMGQVLSLLLTLGYVDIQVERIYPTRRNHNEFWCVLRKLL